MYWFLAFSEGVFFISPRNNFLGGNICIDIYMRFFGGDANEMMIEEVN